MDTTPVEAVERATENWCRLAVEGLLQAAHENGRARRPLGGIGREGPGEHGIQRRQKIRLSDYLRAELGRIAARPTREEMLTRIHGRAPVKLRTPAAVVIREERESV